MSGETGAAAARATDLLSWLVTVPPDERDRAIEGWLGILAPFPSDRDASSPPGDHLIGYHASGVAPIVHALLEAPVVAADVVIDLGAGLGKVVMLAHLLTGASARGIELQAPLVARAAEAASRVGAAIAFIQGDARDAPIDDGTVFFLYLPFTGPVLDEVLGRLHAVAEHHAIVVCALGIDLDRRAPWLVARPLESFWLTVYDSVVSGVRPRDRHAREARLGAHAEVIARELR